MKKYKKAIVIIFVIIISTISFVRQFNIIVDDVVYTAMEKQSRIDHYVDLSKACVDLVSIYGSDYFDYEKTKDSNLFKYIKYDPKTNSFNLDAIKGTEYQTKNGNLTGLGDIPKAGIHKDELNLSLRLNKQFSDIYSKLPDIAWIYFSGDSGFINLYPWVSSSEFSYRTEIKKEKFYSVVTPKNNPLRQSAWTPIYLDQAGKGLMVTISSPVYKKDTFMGVVSIDITNDYMSTILNSEYESYIIDSQDNVIANSRNLTFYDKVPEFKKVINSPKSYIQELKDLKTGSIQRVGSYYIYTSEFHNAPWKMIYRIPVWYMSGKAFIFTLPIIIICILLLLTLFEVERRKTTEVMLKNSVDDLNSYQKLLENAARYDFLTSSVNRRGLQFIFDKSFETKTMDNCAISFIMADIDFFKKFNDSYGHAAGDKVLVEIANIMQKNIKESDVVCRWGGEEFVIMLFDRTCVETMKIAEKIRKQIENFVIPWENSTELKATMTFGVAAHEAGKPLQEGVSNADSAMYYGKQHGRNCVVNYKNCE